MKEQTVPMKEQTVPMKEQSAIHEAGHSVVYSIFCIPVTEVTLLPGPDYRACTRTLHPAKESLSPDAYEFFLYLDAVSLIAGPLAAAERVGEAYWNGTHYRGDGADSKKVAEILTRLMSQSTQTQPAAVLGAQRAVILKELFKVAHAVITDPPVWAAIEAVADALLQEKTLPHRMFDTIVNSALSEPTRKRVQKRTSRKVRDIQTLLAKYQAVNQKLNPLLNIRHLVKEML